MRAGRAILCGAAALLALLVAGIWLVPGMLDWNRYRDTIAALVASGIGRPVRIDGAVTLHLLPQPILTASGIAVQDAGDGVVLTAEELRLRVSLGSLLGGRVDARELTLRGADMRLPWPPPAGALARRPPSWLSGLQARVQDSRLQIGGLQLTGMDASLAIDPDTGTLSTVGEASLAGGSWNFTARLARPGGDGTAGLEASLDGKDKLRDTGGSFSGQLGGDGALTGRVQGRGPDLSQLMPAPPVAWRGEGRLSAASGLAVADELALQIAGSPARGAVALRVQPQARLDIALAAGRIDLDAWLPVLRHAAQPAGRPTIPTGIDLSAEAATLAGGTLRRLRGGFDLDADGVAVRDASALLPGDAQLTLSGRVPAKSDGTLFQGTARLAAPDLRGTLRWLEPLAPAPVGALPEGTLRSADATATVTLDPAQAALMDLHGTLDGSTVQGALTLRIGSRLGIGAGLTLDRLVLDPWLSGLPPLLSAKDAGTAPGRAAFDTNVTLQVRQASWRGMPAGRLALEVQTEAGVLSLRRLEARPLGFRLTASGTLDAAGRVADGKLELAADDVSPLRAVLPADVLPLGLAAVSGLLRGPGGLSLRLSGAPEALAVRGTLDLGDLRLEAQPTINLRTRRWAGPVMLHHPGAPRLLELLGVPGTASWLGDGSLSLLADVTAVPGRVELNGLDFGAGALRLGGQLVLDHHALSGRLAAETLPLPLPYARSPDPLPEAALRGWQVALHVEAQQVLFGMTPALQSASAELSLKDAALRLGQLSAKLSGGTLSGSLAFDAGLPVPRLAVQAAVAGVALGTPVFGGVPDLVGGRLDGNLALAAEGHSPAALLATLDGTAEGTVRDGTASGFNLAKAGAAVRDAAMPGVEAAMRAALAGGTTPFSRLDVAVQARRGVLTGTAGLTDPPGSAALAGNVDLSAATQDLRLALRPDGGPEVAVRLAGPMGQATARPELAGLARWLAERP